MRCRTAALALCVVASLALGCATESQLEEKVIGASPAPDSGFLETPERMVPHRARDPFDRSWVTWYGNAHEIFGQWAQEMVDLANTPITERVEHSRYFTLMPW